MFTETRLNTSLTEPRVVLSGGWKVIVICWEVEGRAGGSRKAAEREVNSQCAWRGRSGASLRRRGGEKCEGAVANVERCTHAEDL